MDSINTQIAHSPTSGLKLHEPFLERAAGDDGAFDGDVGLGAFLTLRLVDQFNAHGFSAGRAAVEYQCSATLRFVEGIRPATNQVSCRQDA